VNAVAGQVRVGEHQEGAENGQVEYEIGFGGCGHGFPLSLPRSGACWLVWLVELTDQILISEAVKRP
jgi:hypothetical protein